MQPKKEFLTMFPSCDLSSYSFKLAKKIIKDDMGLRRAKDCWTLEVGIETMNLASALNIANANNCGLSLNKDFDNDEWQIEILRVGHDRFETLFYSPGA